MIGHTLINPFVSSAGDHQLIDISQVACGCLRQRDTGRCWNRKNTTLRNVLVLPSRALSNDLVESLSPHGRHHHHARATTVRGVVNCAMCVVRPITQIVDMHIDEATLVCLAQQRQIYGREVFGENREKVDPHQLEFLSDAST